MSKPYIMHMITPTKNVSPFDVNMACDAGWDTVIPYTHVETAETTGLVQDAIFSRGPNGVRRTGIFIGGRDVNLAMDMLQMARDAMVPPFEVSVIVDPSGAFLHACDRQHASLAAKHPPEKGCRDQADCVVGRTLSADDVARRPSYLCCKTLLVLGVPVGPPVQQPTANTCRRPEDDL